MLNRKFIGILLALVLFSFGTHAEEPVDIWSIDEKKILKKNNNIKDLEKKIIPENSIYKMQSKKTDESDIKEDQTLVSKEIEIVGLYDPAENGLDINMWLNSDGDKILSLFNAIDKIQLSSDANEILDILLLTNSYYPKKNISKKQFLEIKSKWLIKNSNFELIKKYLSNNKIINDNPLLTKHLVDEYLSRSEINKACEVLFEFEENIQDQYLSKFNIYCLINNNKIEEAQLLLDLKKELGFKDKFYEKRINYLMGYGNKVDEEISEKTILDFHLSHRTNPNFKFEPNNSTSKQIWKYLSTSNLLDNVQNIEITNLEKISIIEKGTHENNYTEKELYDLYKRFQFNINQLLNIKEATKLLTNIESRALIYQGILIVSNTEKKLELINALKKSFINDGIEKAFSAEMRSHLRKINLEEVPSNYTRFYERYINEEIITLKNTKINNKILHQSKLLNYFKKGATTKDIEKDLNTFLKKIKRDKKYYFSIKDIILVEALKSDNIKVSKKFKDLYILGDSEIPTDIQVYINNQDMATAILRIVQLIGQDQLKDIDPETLYFIINILNQLDIDPLRNKILLKVLPLKI